MVGPSRKARCFTQLATSALVSLMCHWHLVLLIYCCVRHVGLKIFFKKQEDVGVHSGFYQATMQKQNQKIIANITTVLSCMMLCSGRFFIKASVCQCSPSLQSALSRCNVAVRQLCICPTFFVQSFHVVVAALISKMTVVLLLDLAQVATEQVVTLFHQGE